MCCFLFNRHNMIIIIITSEVEFIYGPDLSRLKTFSEMWHSSSRLELDIKLETSWSVNYFWRSYKLTNLTHGSTCVYVGYHDKEYYVFP